MPDRVLTEDQKRYQRLVFLLHSLAYTFTTKFVKEEGSRDKILNQLKELVGSTGCSDDWCYDKEKGCVPCDYQQAWAVHTDVTKR